MDEIIVAVRGHAKNRPKDFRSRWRYAMILWHCCEDLDGAASEFNKMSNEFIFIV